MRVHVADVVEAQSTASNARAGTTTPLLEHLFRIYGYSFSVTLVVNLFALGLSSLPYTDWGDDLVRGNEGTTDPVSQPRAQPGVNRNVWTAFIALVCPTVIALRTMFATSSRDPDPLPGKGRFRWRYAPHCFFGMLLSAFGVYSLSYVLPTALGIPLEYYCLELISIALNLSVCVIFTSMLMEHFEVRDRHANAHQGGSRGGPIPGQTQALRGEDQNQGSKATLASELADQLNTILLLLFMLGYPTIVVPICTWCVCEDSYMVV